MVDLNHRPLGYEPSALPLRQSAIYVCATRPLVPAHNWWSRWVLPPRPSPCASAFKPVETIHGPALRVKILMTPNPDNSATRVHTRICRPQGATPRPVHRRPAAYKKPGSYTFPSLLLHTFCPSMYRVCYIPRFIFSSVSPRSQSADTPIPRAIFPKASNPGRTSPHS